MTKFIMTIQVNESRQCSKAILLERFGQPVRACVHIITKGYKVNQITSEAGSLKTCLRYEGPRHGNRGYPDCFPTIG